MRNGNISVCTVSNLAFKRSYRTYEEWKRYVNSGFPSGSLGFLPYLWGMETWKKTKGCGGYEEFLPYLWGMETNQHFYNTSYINSSYRTYEEWKPYIRNNLHASFERSYRTYEEWKLFHGYHFHNILFSVLTVPMRNGNLYDFLHSWKWAIVLTVPMRNGNYAS